MHLCCRWLSDSLKPSRPSWSSGVTGRFWRRSNRRSSEHRWTRRNCCSRSAHWRRSYRSLRPMRMVKTKIWSEHNWYQTWGLLLRFQWRTKESNVLKQQEVVWIISSVLDQPTLMLRSRFLRKDWPRFGHTWKKSALLLELWARQVSHMRLWGQEPGQPWLTSCVADAGQVYR